MTKTERDEFRKWIQDNTDMYLETISVSARKITGLLNMIDILEEERAISLGRGFDLLTRATTAEVKVKRLEEENENLKAIVEAEKQAS